MYLKFLGVRMNKKLEISKNMLFIILITCLIISGVIGYIYIRSSVQYNVRDEIYELGIEAINFSDRYLDGRIPLDSFIRNIRILREAIDEFEDKESSERVVRSLVSVLSLGICYDSIFNNRNNLAELLNQPIREN